MMRRSGFAALMTMLCCASPAMAQGSGTWRVNGEVSGRAFVVDCRFEERGAQLGGVCTDIDKNGKVGKQHPLSRGSVRGQAMRWTYPAKVMMMSIDIDFAGTMDGRGMTGTVTAKGREGKFTAKRL